MSPSTHGLSDRIASARIRSLWSNKGLHVLRIGIWNQKYTPHTCNQPVQRIQSSLPQQSQHLSPSCATYLLGSAARSSRGLSAWPPWSKMILLLLTSLIFAISLFLALASASAPSTGSSNFHPCTSGSNWQQRKEGCCPSPCAEYWSEAGLLKHESWLRGIEESCLFWR